MRKYMYEMTSKTCVYRCM